MTLFRRAAADAAAVTELGNISDTAMEPHASLAAQVVMAEGVATTDDLATVPSPGIASQEVALADGTKMPLVESPATNNQQLSSLEASPSSSLSRAEQLSQAIISSNDKQALELRKALSSLAATYKVIIYLSLAPKDRVSSLMQRGT